MLEIHQHLIKVGRNIPTILITAHPDERVRAKAQRLGTLGFLSKPFDDSELIGLINQGIKCAASASMTGKQPPCPKLLICEGSRMSALRQKRPFLQIGLPWLSPFRADLRDLRISLNSVIPECQSAFSFDLPSASNFVRLSHHWRTWLG